MTRLRESIQNDVAQYRVLARKVLGFLRDCGLPSRAAYVARMAVEELVVNVINYGFDDAAEHTIEVEITCESERVVVHIEDDGRPFDPRTAGPPALKGPLSDRPVGGWGIHMVRSMSTRISYQRRGTRNVVEVEVALEPAAR